jgi:hypothetical protein
MRKGSIFAKFHEISFRENFSLLRQFSRKYQKNFAKIENADFRENLVVFRENYCEDEKRRFSRKYCLFFAESFFSKMKNSDFFEKFCENECYSLKNFYENKNFLLKNSRSIFGMRIQILIWNTDPDPHSEYGSGSAFTKKAGSKST